jgi:serine phosphatase RsbU (regulator of sigma subunit)
VTAAGTIAAVCAALLALLAACAALHLRARRRWAAERLGLERARLAAESRLRREAVAAAPPTGPSLREKEWQAERQKAEQATRALAEWKRSVLDSIQYAGSIQERVLPDVNEVRRHYRDAFIYLRPRDVVSGDFYWFAQHGDVRLLVCADCTGHGVPGALMTLLGNFLLHRLATPENVGRPADVLEALDAHFGELAGRGSLPLRDGMEVAACSLDASGGLAYAGARLPLFLARANGGLETLEGTRRSIGLASARASKPPFVQVRRALERGDSFYMATDGFQDQFGGSGRRKFMRKRLAAHLAAIQDRPMAEQARELNRSFEHWKGEQPQVDDVLVIGVRV